MAKFILFQGRDRQYYFSLVATNGEIIATSEGYTTKQSAKNGIESVKRYAPVASVIDRS